MDSHSDLSHAVLEDWPSSERAGYGALIKLLTKEPGEDGHFIPELYDPFSKDGQIVLEHACMLGRVEVVHALLGEGIVDPASNNSRSLSHAACCWKMAELIPL